MVIFDGKIFLYLIKHGKINSVSQYFPNDQSMMLQNLKLLKVCLKYQLGQILQLTFNLSPLADYSFNSFKARILLGSNIYIAYRLRLFQCPLDNFS